MSSHAVKPKVSEAGRNNACAGCSGEPGRRDFLRDATLAVTAFLAATGAARAELAALSIRWSRGEPVRERELRYPLPAKDGATIDRDNEVILVRWQRTAFAFALSCPHQRTMLKWLEREQRFQCPKHKSRYRPDGSFISGRATRGMDRYPLRLDAGTVVVDTASSIQQDNDAAAWVGAVVKLA